jgi:hypothetical protein
LWRSFRQKDAAGAKKADAERDALREVLGAIVKKG